MVAGSGTNRGNLCIFLTFSRCIFEILNDHHFSILIWYQVRFIQGRRNHNVYSNLSLMIKQSTGVSTYCVVSENVCTTPTQKVTGIPREKGQKQKWNFQRGWGCNEKTPSVGEGGGAWMLTGTTHPGFFHFILNNCALIRNTNQ